MRASYLDDTLLPRVLQRMEDTDSWRKLGFWIKPPAKILKSVFNEKKTLIFHDNPVIDSKNIHSLVFLQNIGLDKRFPTVVAELLLFSNENLDQIIELLKQLANMMSKRYLRIIGSELPETELESFGYQKGIKHEKYYRCPDGSYLPLSIGIIDLTTDYPDLRRKYAPLTDEKRFYPRDVDLKKPREFSAEKDVFFRWVQPSDAPSLARFDGQWNVVRAIGTGVHLNQRSVDVWKRLLVDPVQLMRLGVFLVAINKKNGEIIGSCTIFQDLNRPGKFHVGEMGITVAAEYQGLGVGTRLLKEAFTTSMKKGMRLIVFSSFESNIPGTKLYEKLGCRIVGKLPGWFVEGETSEIFWEKWLG